MVERGVWSGSDTTGEFKVFVRWIGEWEFGQERFGGIRRLNARQVNLEGFSRRRVEWNTAFEASSVRSYAIPLVIFKYHAHHV